MAEERLQKILSQAGVASRRQAEKIIVEGRVTVNGAVITELGSKADLERDHIKVDGRLLHAPKRLAYIVLNKPNSTVTTVNDPEGRPTVMELLRGVKERVYPVGRLDYHSEGLLLLTNDGEIANAITSAATHLTKTYVVKVTGRLTHDQEEQFRRGVPILGKYRGDAPLKTWLLGIAHNECRRLARKRKLEPASLEFRQDPSVSPESTWVDQQALAQAMAN